MLLKSRIKNCVYLSCFILGKLLYPFRLLWNDYVSRIIEYLYSGCLSCSIRISKGAIIRFPSVMIKGPGISIGRDSLVGKYAVITTWRTDTDNQPQIMIGDGTNIGQNCHITAANRIIIGDRVLTGKYVTITDNSHGQITKDNMLMDPNKRKLSSKGPVIIEDNVWIGDKVTICPNVRVGEGSIIGANSVVTKDIPSYSVAVGNPLRIIKTF